MPRKKVTADTLASEIMKIIDEYNEIVTNNVDEVAHKVATKTRRALINESMQFNERWGHGRYSGGWKVTRVVDKWMITYVIHNTREPGLTHLLEEGHELVYMGNYTGKRTRAFPHISKVAESVPEDFTKESIDAVRRASGRY